MTVLGTKRVKNVKNEQKCQKWEKKLINGTKTSTKMSVSSDTSNMIGMRGYRRPTVDCSNHISDIIYDGNVNLQ